MLRILTQPYPSSDLPVGRQLLRAGIIGGFVGLFLLLFQPFGMNIWRTEAKALKILGFGGITFLVTFIHFTIWPRLLPAVFAEQRWTVWKEILFILLNILLIALANRFYLVYLTDQHASLPNFIWMLLATLLIGIFPTVGSVLINYIVQLRKYSQAAAELPVTPHEPAPQHPLPDITAPTHPDVMPLTLVAENEKDTLTLLPAELLFIESSDNYCTVHFLRQGQPARVLLRSSLSRMEGQLPQQVHSPFVRCHRSYVVNLDQVVKVTGNAQGYKLHLQAGEYQVPVARKYNDTLVAELKEVAKRP